MKYAFISVALLFSLNIAAQSDNWETHFEKSGGVATPDYESTVTYCKALDDASEMVKYTTFGVSPQGRPLPLLIIDRKGNFTPDRVKASGNAILLLQAGIHPGEIDGKDAGLMFFRDLIIHEKLPGLLDGLTYLFIPIFSVDGHERSGPYNRINQDGPEEMGWRANALNLNLNRDYLKVDAPETIAWLKLFREWLPDFFVDFHVTDGADYQYAVTYALEVNGNMDEGLTKWTENTFIPYMESEMEESGYPVFPYVMFRRWHDPRSGLRSSVSPPRLSQGYTALQNRIGMLVENHSLKDFKTRVYATYELYRIIAEVMVAGKDKLKELNAQADQRIEKEATGGYELPVDWEAGPDSVMVEFKGVEYDVVESDLTGGPWFKYHPDKPATFSVPLFNDLAPSKTVSLPYAYIIPLEWSEVIQRIVWHGIDYFKIDEPAEIEVETYRFREPIWANSPYEGRFRVSAEYEVDKEKLGFPAGSVVIPVNQRTARVIAHILEPEAPDSYLGWGFFNAIFEQKEYSETYVMEGIAREMIKEDPELLNEFEEWKENHPQAAQSQWAQLNWFYSKSPWWDSRKNLYPVGRITDKKVLDDLQ